MNKQLHIAIDGPVAAGKGTVSRIVADRLGWLYVDTGAMYRSTALLAIRNDIDLKNLPKGLDRVIELLKTTTISLRNPQQDEKDGRLVTVLLNGEDVSWEIRTPECSTGASIVSQYPEIRDILVQKQQQIAETQHVVMEGRDITFKVLPQAKIKIYLDADLETRASRRHQELLSKGFDITFEQVKKEIRERDERDMTRKIDPLHIEPDAWNLDTSGLSIEEVVQKIEEKARKLLDELMHPVSR